MKLYDIIYDKDAYISGLVIGKLNDEFLVLWDNDVVGRVLEEYEEIEVVGHSNIKKFIIKDILHTGHHGNEFESKIGEKYDRHRNKLLLLNMDSLIQDRSLRLQIFNIDEYNDIVNGRISESNSHNTIYTTAFERIYEDKGYSMLRTLNSIYKLEEVE